MQNVTIKCNQGSVSISAPDNDGEIELTIYEQEDFASLYVDKARAEKIILALKERFELWSEIDNFEMWN